MPTRATSQLRSNSEGSGLSRHASLFYGVLWPPAAPVTFVESRGWWIAACALAVIPNTAILHNLVFYRYMCMLNNFGPEYDPATVSTWLSRDPSLPWAALCSVLLCYLGDWIPQLQVASAAYFISFLPLSIWIWDIPFTHRIVCSNFHDGRSLFVGVIVHTRYVYVVCLSSWIVLTLFVVLKRRRSKLEKLP
jgi:hypothetical protein